MTKDQCRAARALLGWTIRDLEERSGITRNAISGFESGRTKPQHGTLYTLRSTLEAGGVEFTNGGQPGVRFAAGRGQ